MRVRTGRDLPAVFVKLHNHGSVGGEDPERFSVLVEYCDEFPGYYGGLPS